MWIVLAWLGCDADPPVEPDPCRPGFSLGPDGHCYPPPPRYPDPTVEDALENLPGCEPREPGERLDIAAGCADGRCVDDQFESFVASFGPPESCRPIDPLGQQVECDFGEGRLPVFAADSDEPAPSDRAIWIRLRADFEGSDPTGLGLGIGPRCFVEQLGVPDRVSFEQVNGVLEVVELRWEVTGPDAELLARDVERSNGGNGPDGAIDNLFLLPR